MVVGICRITIKMPEIFSLKDKRQIISSLKGKIRSRYNVSVAEVGRQDEKRLSELALAAVGTGRDQIHRVFMSVLRLVENDGRGELIDFALEWF